VPNRIYRGRVVEVLRSLKPRQQIRASKLGRQIRQGFDGKDSRWFARVLKGLERDGLVELTKNGSAINVGLPE
jgi:DNA-binding HxlR family transcriptional regulator